MQYILAKQALNPKIQQPHSTLVANLSASRIPNLGPANNPFGERASAALRVRSDQSRAKPNRALNLRASSLRIETRESSPQSKTDSSINSHAHSSCILQDIPRESFYVFTNSLEV